MDEPTMLRKLSAVMLAVILSLFGFGGLASADPTDYPVTTEVSVNISGAGIVVVDGVVTVQVGVPFTFSGQGFDPGEGIAINVDGPSGLRRSAGLVTTLASVPNTSADANGSFATPITFANVGTATLTATGLTSGKTASLAVQVVGAGSGGGSPGTTVSVVGTGGSGVGAGNGSAGAGGTTDGGLAYTGASIAGPLAIGFVALFAGLALLFFGTRGVRRRRNSQAV